MEINLHNFEYEPGEVFSFSLLETHFGAQLCDLDEYHKVMTIRCRDPRHYAIYNGDLADMILPRDEKRYTSSATVREITSRDDYLNATEEYCLEHLDPYKERILLINKGNHEMQIEKRSGYDISSGLVAVLRDRGSPVKFGGYSGFCHLRFIAKGAKAKRGLPAETYTLFHHHGAWAGENIRVQVKRFAYQHYGWNGFLFSHNHAQDVWPDVRFCPNIKTLELKVLKVLFMNSGAFLRSYSGKGTIPDYAEIRAHPARFLGAPLLQIKPTWGHGCKARVVAGEDFGEWQ